MRIFEPPSREFWSRKGCHSHIRHVDPPQKKNKTKINNLLQQLKLTQQARAHDPGPPRRQKMCNCLQMRAPGLPGCVTVKDCEKLTCQSAQLSAALSCYLHLALVGLHLVSSVVDSHASLHPPREFWPPKGRHNRIRHVDPPPGNLFQ